MSGAQWRQFVRWTADSFRFVGALAYWNGRKQLFVQRRRTGRCPCQNPSDDNIPGRVRCDAVAHWHSPARFRRICPLLVHTEHGWCCSVRESAVRPFWGRAAAWAGVLFLSAYLLGATAVFGLLRVGGRAPVSWAQIAWPPKWSEIRRVQSATLYAHAMQAFQTGRLGEAALALNSARQRDPLNYEAGLLLAQVAMFQRSFLHADDTFAALLREHPAERLRTAVTYHDTLLALNRLEELAELSLTMAVAEEGPPAVWVRSLLVAVRKTGGAAELRSRRAADIARLAPHAQLLLEAEAWRESRGTAAAVDRLTVKHAGPFNPVYMAEQVRRLAELGAATAAQDLLDYYGPILGSFEHALLQVVIDHLNGDAVAAEANTRQLFNLPLTPAQGVRIAAQLIEHPRPQLFSAFQQRLQDSPRLLERTDAAAVWAAALACGAPRDAAAWRVRVQARGEAPPTIGALDFASRDLGQESSVAHVVNTVTLPREVVLALLTRVQLPASAPRALP